jgi:hypothetical protein
MLAKQRPHKTSGATTTAFHHPARRPSRILRHLRHCVIPIDAKPSANAQIIKNAASSA